MTKLISFETANKMLPLLKSITTEIMVLWKETRAAKHILDTDMDLSGDDYTSISKSLQKRADRLVEVLDEVEALGCSIENYGKGIIDIPSELNGRKVLLCWTHGEDSIRYYHLPGESSENRILIESILE